MISLRQLRKDLGLAQTRCTHCLAPFTTESGSETGIGAAPQGLADSLAALCPTCTTLFAPYAGPRCPACALPLSAEQTPCGECLLSPPPWDGIAAYGLYQGALRDALLRLKFGGEFALAQMFGACLLHAARSMPLPDAIAAVPQHPVHLRRRGFNQAHEIAKALHRRIGIPLRPDLLRRSAPHTPQTGLTAAERRGNVHQAFEAATEAGGLRLWLVDDVMTTGVTLRAAAEVLRAAGVRETRILVVARTPLSC